MKIKNFLIIVLSFLCFSCEKDRTYEAGTYMYDGQLFSLIPAAVSDVDGNSYDAVKMGKQIWMRQNLRTTKYADGTPIVQGSDTSSSQPYWYYVNNDVSNTPTYGLLYNWKAVMRNSYSSDANPSGVQGICPNGWHVPSSVEWDELFEYVGSQSRFVCDNVNGFIAKALASSIGWQHSTTSCTPGNKTNANNATGFSALPAGCFSMGKSLNFCEWAFFWSTSRSNYFYSEVRGLWYDYAYIYNGSMSKSDGYSVRCLRDALLPTITTNAVSRITPTTAICGGNVSDDGGATVTARGVCWSRNHNPTISGNHTSDGNGIGSFMSNISGLIAGTTYYARAYATNSEGTAYGNEVCFTTEIALSVPTVTTSSVTSITATTAICGGNVTDDGGAIVTARGVCWSISHNPTTSDSHTTDGSGTGSFISNLIGLYAGTTFYVRAYATNSAGTAYGNEVSFITENHIPEGDAQPCPGVPIVTDVDGNVYNTVKIGNQCWMKENLRTTRYANGVSVSSTLEDGWYYPNGVPSNKPTYGLLYNWRTVMGNSSSSSDNPSGVQGICPNGWHVPSDAEWTQLTDYVSSQSRYVCGNDNTYIAKALASTTEWNSSTATCAVGNTPANNNVTGFSALPAGTYGGGYYFNFGRNTSFSSATEYSSSDAAHIRGLRYINAVVDRSHGSKDYSFSVRCVKD